MKFQKNVEATSFFFFFLFFPSKKESQKKKKKKEVLHPPYVAWRYYLQLFQRRWYF